MRKVSVSFTLIYFLFLFSFQSCAQETVVEEKPFDYSTTLLSQEKISSNEKLIFALKRLHEVFKNKEKANYRGNDSVFTILHIGDSHIQGDYFTSVIRKELQNYFGNAGQGILFPYALSQSYGPRGLEISTKGKWKGVKTMSPNLIYNLGLSGYGTFVNTTNSSLSIYFNEKFEADPPLNKLAPVQKLNIWHSAGTGSFITGMDDQFRLIDSKLFPSGWGVSTFISKNKTNGFTIHPENTNGGQYYYGFYGFELLPMEQRGIIYHHCGVVGAQFTHLINQTKFSIEQIQLMKPDIIIFSFGTNEAYNGNFNSENYQRSVKKFISEIQNASPGTAIIFTTVPDTRSKGRIPPHQESVNKAITEIAQSTNSSLYDLFSSMGGWGSMNTWFKKQLTLTDKLHFNKDGYAIQGKMFAMALLESYNNLNKIDTLNLNPIRKSITESMRILVKNKTIKVTDSTRADSYPADYDSESDGVQLIKVEKQNKKVRNKKKEKLAYSKKKIHIVRKGDTLSRISKVYHLKSTIIAKANGITIGKLLRPGQKLIIPSR